MATNTTTTVIDHTSDAGFRAWSSEVSTALQAVGLVKTSDTGQINFTTVTRPATGVIGGYEVYRFNDTMQATAPIFFKIEYGTSSASATVPNIVISVAAGSNGSGTLTGLTTARVSVLAAQAIASTSTNYPTNVCAVSGYAGLAFKRGSMASSTGAGGFTICRSVDSAGAPTADGIVIYYGASSASTAANAVCVSYTANVIYTLSTAYCMVGFGVTTSLVSGLIQVYKHYMITPRMICNPFMFTCIQGEIGPNSQFSATPVGSLAHNYLALGQCFGAASVNGVSPTHSMCMCWE